MHTALDKWTDYVAAIVLTIRLEEQNPSLRYDNAILETIHSLQDLVDTTEAAMNELPGPKRRRRSVAVVTVAFSTEYPGVTVPPLNKKFSDVLRGVAKTHSFIRSATRFS